MIDNIEKLPEEEYHFFNSLLKDKTKVKCIDKQNGVVNVVLENGTYLFEVFHELPPGLINKTETGIGATSLELKANRNSIIVEPIKVTASAKAASTQALYIGSATALHPNPVSDDEIFEYLNNSDIQNKKIMVVADSLDRLFKLMGKLDVELFKEYFLMLDEVDSFQMDSTFRQSMALCLDIYKLFPEKNRALVSATTLPLSDPELARENKTILKYEKPSPHNISLIHTENLEGAVVDHLFAFGDPDSQDKVLVAWNSVSGCISLADHLVNKQGYRSEDIKILCSINNQVKAGKYFTQLDSDYLPGKVNMVTSAYFSGYDLHEKFHLIIVSGGRNLGALLSEHKIKQIAGRCRIKNGLLSETVIYSIKSKSMGNPRTLEDLITAADHQIAAMNCFEINYGNNIILKRSLEDIRSLIIKNTKIENHRLVRKDKNNRLVVDYLGIDAYLETKRTIDELYQNAQSLPDALSRAGHIILCKNVSSQTKVVAEKLNNDQIDQMIDVTIHQLRNTEGIQPVNLMLLDTSLISIQKNIIKAYKQYMFYVQKDDLLQLLAASTKGGRDVRKLQNTITALFFTCLDDAHVFKRTALHHFKLGNSYTSEQLKQIWNQIFIDMGFGKIQFKTTNEGVRFTNTFFETKRPKKNYTLISTNPLKIEVVNRISANLSIMNIVYGYHSRKYLDFVE